MKVGRHNIKITKPDKVLFPDEGYTKQDLIDYYHKMADHVLPYTKDRPISMQRFPDGIDGEGFYQKETPTYFPKWIKQISVSAGDSRQRQVMCNNKATLVYLANQACITPHIWLSKKGGIRKPDQMIFDLDPEDGGYKTAVEGAKILRKIADAVGLTAFVKLTGSRGVHVVLPIRPRKDFYTVRSIARDIARVLVGLDDSKFTLEQRKNKRKGRLYIDVQRNAFGQTVVPPYAVRARKKAPVAAPIDWDELDGSSSAMFTIESIEKRLAKKGDIWKGMHRRAASLKKIDVDRLINKLQ
jgi:bifunctional non-homologous end joining protein LigD